MSAMISLFKLLFKLGIFCFLLCSAAITGAYLYFEPQLPKVETLRDIHLQTPLQIYSKDKKLIAEFGEKRRTPVRFEEIPPQFIHALTAAEDSRFFSHFGIDIKGLTRAAFQLATTGRIQSGGSTITMQVAKNFFLTRERTFTRKFMEILLALKIEQELSKEEIFSLYINKIYLGHRSYGIQAASNVYYGKNLKDLSLSQFAMIAGLPKAPSAYNPITNPSRAIERRNWILKRMHSLSFINDQELEEASNAPVTAKYHSKEIELRAFYLAEMVRKELYDIYGEELYTDGYKVYTTIQSPLQEAANNAVSNGLIAYTERHGYFGPEAQWDLKGLTEAELSQKLNKVISYGVLEPALILSISDRSATLLLKDGQKTDLTWEGLSWAKKHISVNRTGKAPQKASDVVQVGDLIRIRFKDNIAHLTQIPKVQGSLVSLAPQDGAIVSLVGGFNFTHNKFNRSTQAVRQPGSNFKPFIYAAALNKGYTPASLINDAPIVFHDKNLEGNWRPENYSRKFYGPTRLREALYKSRNLVSIRLLRSIGIDTAQDYLHLAGFDKDKLPNNLSLSLGSADVTPLQLVTGYATFANGGFKVTPYFIDRIENPNGELLFTAHPKTACKECDPEAISVDTIAPRIYDEKVVFLTYNIMQDVIRQGTGRKAQVLKRNDIAGKTGTTNDQKDAWFSGFNQDYVATAWVGFDQPTTLGRREFGGTAALPIWIDFMREALKEKPENAPIPPEGIVNVKIDPRSGKLAYPGQADAVYEYFREENVPTGYAAPTSISKSNSAEELF
ncbi:penicillin-binding protein 1A [uncultured Neptuniibacter sp.]|uniref:penicillin-binding protein 1A n=1 Tax=uncultured Neptuniibacter sp. TaxID=502143 RepID=UPI0026071D1E|nr:penicillin-binding protein 1A [uncultured Neptuniibacter sp.]